MVLKYVHKIIFFLIQLLAKLNIVLIDFSDQTRTGNPICNYMHYLSVGKGGLLGHEELV